MLDTSIFQNVPQKIPSPVFLNNIPQRNPFPGESSSCWAFVNSFAGRSVSLAIYTPVIWSGDQIPGVYIERDELDKIAQQDAEHAYIYIFLYIMRDLMRAFVKIGAGNILKYGRCLFHFLSMRSESMNGTIVILLRQGHVNVLF